MVSHVNPDSVPPGPGAARVGSELRAARQRLGWQLPDVAAGLRIKPSYLEGIEEGRLAGLPGNAYAMGFVRTYAATLGLNPDEVSRRFRAEAGEVNQKTRLSFPAPVPQRGVPAGAVVLLGLLIAAGAYLGWYRYSGSDEAMAISPATPPPERLAAMARQTQSPQVASILPAIPPPAAAKAPLPPAAANAPLPPAAANTPLPPALATPAPAIAAPAPVPAAIAPPAPVAVPAAAATRFGLRAKSGGFVLVKERLGKTLLRRVMEPGETWPVPAAPDLLLTTTNAGDLELLVDGKVAQPMGAAGTVLNDLPLRPALAKAGRANSTGGRLAR